MKKAGERFTIVLPPFLGPVSTKCPLSDAIISLLYQAYFHVAGAGIF